MPNWEKVTIAKQLQTAVQQYGDDTALVFKGEKWTYGELYQESAMLAAGLCEIGVKKGDRVGTLFGNAPEWVLTKYALHIIGSVIVPINVNFRTEELKYILRQGAIQTLIMTDKLKSGDYVGLLTEVDPNITKGDHDTISSKIIPDLQRIVCLSPSGKRYLFCHDFLSIIESGRSCNEKKIDDMIAMGAPEDICNILFTSGSTAFPKGAMHNHTSLLGIGLHLIPKTFNMAPRSKLLCNFPFYHIAGCVYFPLGALTGGYELHVNEFIAPEVLEIINSQKINFFCGFEAHFNALANDPKFNDYDLESVGNILLAAGPEWYDKCRNVFPGAKVIAHHYGFSEGTGVSMSFEEVDHNIRKHTNGKPWPGIEVKIIDPYTGDQVGPDNNGEICLRGWSRFQGYYNNEEETRKAIDRDGFFHSGDYGCKDLDGNISYRGRYKMMIKTGGENVSEREVEIFLEGMSGVRSVQVIGVPHEKWGEAVTAIIEIEPEHRMTEKDVFDFCIGKISKFKIPKKIHFISSGEWPLLGSGKINKIALKEKIVCQ